GRAIAVDVAEHCRKAEIGRSRFERLAISRQKSSVRPRGAGEMAVAIVEVERIRFADLDHVAVDDLDPRGIAPRYHVASIDLTDRNGAAAAQDRYLAIIGDVKVEVAVAVDVRQSERVPARLENEPGSFGDVFEPAISA